MNLKVPGAILPLGCAILSTWAKTVRGLVQPPLGELGLRILNTLSFDYNKNIRIHVEMFRDLINLLVLSLGDNRLIALTFDLFQYTKKIRVLNISDNKLLDIPDIRSLHELFYLKGALDKFNIIPQLFPKKSWNFYTIRSVGMGNDCMPSFTF